MDSSRNPQNTIDSILLTVPQEIHRVQHKDIRAIQVLTESVEKEQSQDPRTLNSLAKSIDITPRSP